MLKKKQLDGWSGMGSESKSGIIRTFVHQTVIPANDLVGIIFARNANEEENVQEGKGISTFTQSHQHQVKCTCSTETRVSGQQSFSPKSMALIISFPFEKKLADKRGRKSSDKAEYDHPFRQKRHIL